MTIKNIKIRRAALNLSQAELANALGVTQAAVSAWETGQKLPRASQLPALASVLHCTIDDLYAGTEAENDAESGR